MLIVPDGILALDDSAAAALELVDGARTLEAIVAVLAERFATPRSALEREARELFESLQARGFVSQKGRADGEL